jgi:cysteine desulfurase family protein (TIGR01976 family)
MSYDVARVRATYPALAEGFAHLDGAAGTQAAAPVIDAIAGTLRRAVSNRSTAFEAGRRAGEIVTAAREAVADLVGAVPAGVVFGPSATSLTYVVARTLAQSWGPGDEVVVSRLDHDANIRPWVQAAEGAGATVRWAEIDPDTGDLPAKQYADLIGPHTRLVAVTAASNVTGAMPRVREIADLAHAAGALIYVDGVHATAHVPTDVHELGADFYVTSAYKWSGPHLAAVTADPALWEQLRPAKLIPSSDAVPERFEFGTPSFELLAGVTAAVNHLAALPEISGATPGPAPDRRARILSGLKTAAAYESELLNRLLEGLAANPTITVYPAPAHRCPTVSFRVHGQSPAETAQLLGDQGICVFSGDYYAYEYFTAAGLRDTGGAVRASIYHYNTPTEINRLLTALKPSAA